MPDKHKLPKRMIEEILNNVNLSNLPELVSGDVGIHDTDKELRGIIQLRQGIDHLHTAFPDAFM